MTCNWCELSDKEKKYLLFQSQYWSVYLADEQDYIGRCILVCNRHCASLSELTIEEWGELGEIVKKTEVCMKSVLGAEMCNWSCLMNNFYKESQPNPHLHIHVRPRFRKPVAINENSYSDEEFGHHYDVRKNGQISEKDRETIYQQMKGFIRKI